MSLTIAFLDTIINLQIYHNYYIYNFVYELLSTQDFINKNRNTFLFINIMFIFIRSTFQFSDNCLFITKIKTVESGWAIWQMPGWLTSLVAVAALYNV